MLRQLLLGFALAASLSAQAQNKLQVEPLPAPSQAAPAAPQDVIQG